MASSTTRDSIVGAVLFFLQPGDLAVELHALGGQPAVAAHEVVELLDFLAEFSRSASSWATWQGPPLRSRMRLRDVSNSPQHVDQRDAVHARAEVVEQLGGLGVAERAEFLHFAQSDGEDVVEDRLVDVRQEDLEQVLALPGAVGGGQGEFLVAGRVRPGRRGGRSGSGRWARPLRSSRRAGRRGAGGR